ncbi:MAG: hypothetical protein IK012_04730 [Fibrobacter sp.]|uniref:hypothetical protein n=1 Tax=Fibrobacter sp. TaxID=35828 RepID=UPI0025BCC710|nr:hypothetical protein [Fibrobacter sp.]MBR4784543.1 hypothetical protein [Fibrobacter sp.]
MATIRIDDSESFVSMCKRQAAGLKLISDEIEQENREQKELRELQKKSFERKKKLLYDNLDLIMRHKEEILATPRYANIDAHYAIRGGGLYVGPLSTARWFSFAGTFVTINLKLATLLRIWDTDQFKVQCKCGGTAVIRSFTGSPLSGGSQATAYCPECKNEPHVANRSFGKYFWFLQAKLSEDIETVARDFIAKWTLAEVEHEKKTTKENHRDSKPGAEFHGDGTPCNLETMINELRLKEFDESVYTQRTGNDNICHNI